MKLPKNAKEIPEFPGYYATPKGAIWSGPKQGAHSAHYKLKPAVDKNGYLRIHLYKNRVRYCRGIHRLILETFVGPCPAGMQGCHNNDVSDDNWLSNLRWDTPSNNIKDAVRNKRRGLGEKSSNVKLNSFKVRVIRRLLDSGSFKHKEIAKLFNVTISAIASIKHCRTWKTS